MARIRTIKPEFWADEKLAPLSPVDRLVFLGLISMADDHGRVVDSVRAIDGFIFPATEDTCRESLDRLVELERIERGVTGSGQRIIQIASWSRHQRIDKPNFAAALPQIVVYDPSSIRRRKIPTAIADFVWERDKDCCQECERDVRRNKHDRYDAGEDLGEIDHIIPVVDGGTNDPQNLQLLCLPCNRTKAGDAVRRRNQEASATKTGNVVEPSAPRSTSTINDLRPPTRAGGGEKKRDTAEALELLDRIKALREEQPTPQQGTKIFIRQAKVREALGDEVAKAFQTFGGGGRLLNSKPEHWGIIARDFADVLARQRGAA